MFRRVARSSISVAAPGIDALEYAQRGYRVLAYDNSAGMVGGIRSGVVAGSRRAKFYLPWTTRRSSIAGPIGRSPSAVTANFAVLNSIRDLPPLFEMFAERLAPPGLVMVSILNPLHWTKLKEPHWWLQVAQARAGRCSIRRGRTSATCIS